MLEAGVVVDDRYTIVETIATESGEATVYGASDPGGETVALKLYRYGHVPELDVLERLRELSHPNVLELLAYGMGPSNRWYEAYPFADGGTAADRIPHGGDDLLESAVPQLLAALEELHSKGILHRDVKPENIFYPRAKGAELALGDFGAARFRHADTKASYIVASSVMGTVGYLAPETIYGGIGDFSDYFSLGMTLIRLLGVDPLDRYGRWADWNMALSKDAIDVQSMVPGRIGVLIDGLILPHYEHRWGADEVRRFLGGESVEIVRTGGDRWRSLFWKGHTLADKAAVADFLFEGSSDARNLVESGSLRSWLVESNNDVETWNDVRMEIDAAQGRAAMLRAAAFALWPERPFVAPSGERLDDPTEVYTDLDENLNDYLAGGEHQQHQLQLYVRHRLGGDALERLDAGAGTTIGSKLYGFFTHFLYMLEPGRPFRGLDGSYLTPTGDAHDDLRRVAEELERKREECVRAYGRFREELVAFLDARGLTVELEWVRRCENQYTDPADRVLRLLFFLLPERGIRSPAGRALRTAEELGLDLLAHAPDWVGNDIARADSEAYADVHSGEEPWGAIHKQVRGFSSLGPTDLRSIAITALAPKRKLRRVRIVEQGSRGAHDTTINWRLETWHTLADSARDEGIDAADFMLEAHSTQELRLSTAVDGRSAFALTGELPERDEFDGSFGGVETEIRRMQAREGRQLRMEEGRARWADRISAAAPVVAGAVVGIGFAILTSSLDWTHSDAFFEATPAYLGSIATFPIWVWLVRLLLGRTQSPVVDYKGWIGSALGWALGWPIALGLLAIAGVVVMLPVSLVFWVAGGDPDAPIEFVSALWLALATLGYPILIIIALGDGWDTPEERPRRIAALVTLFLTAMITSTILDPTLFLSHSAAPPTVPLPRAFA